MGQAKSDKVVPIIYQDEFEQEEYDFEIEIDNPPSDEEIELWTKEQESVQMEEADAVVLQIQQVIDGAQSYPINQEELATKFQAVLSNYELFFKLEYFNSINHYVQMAVKRSTGVEWSEKDIEKLWTN